MLLHRQRRSAAAKEVAGEVARIVCVMAADPELRMRIISEIKRSAEASGGQAPGQGAFAKLTGIAQHEWMGVFWARWTEALLEAGYRPNTWTTRFQTSDVLLSIVRACRFFGHVPSKAEMQLYRRSNSDFPSVNTIANHFAGRADMLTALVDFTGQDEANRDVTDMANFQLTKLNTQRSKAENESAIAATKEGHVYLLKSGDHYKIGRSSEIERRIKEVRIALPEQLTLVHAISTDDAVGIEAYWHKRFADRRANGEWFRLSGKDIAAFKRRTFQ